MEQNCHSEQRDGPMHTAPNRVGLVDRRVNKDSGGVRLGSRRGVSTPRGESNGDDGLGIGSSCSLSIYVEEFDGGRPGDIHRVIRLLLKSDVAGSRTLPPLNLPAADVAGPMWTKCLVREFRRALRF